MAEWHELSEAQKQHANVFVDVIDALNEAEREAFDSIKHDYQQAKVWLDAHPKIKKAGLTFTGLSALYVIKRFRMGSPRR
jgi:hypothetical protein